MRITTWITSTVARIVRDVAEAPRVSRELRQRRATETAKPAPLAAEDVKGEVPEVADIETAARVYDKARNQTNAAARLKRSAEKVLKRTPDGQYGGVVVERFESSREVADLDAIRAVFKAHGLGEVPMKRCAPSLAISWAEQAAGDATPALQLADAA